VGVTPHQGGSHTDHRAKQDRRFCSMYDVASEMLNAQKYLERVRKRGEANAELTRVYRNIRQRGLFFAAYGKLYSNEGATTPGVNPDDTVDGMSLQKIDTIRNALEHGTYQWKPVRRTYIEKKMSKKLRPLGLPGWRDKLLQEVISMVLEAYYEPQFRKSSHGFRPNRGCHTALNVIRKRWTGTKWFVETDISGCVDNLDHHLVIEI
jgi:retron-type reverse transcriptase